MSIFVKFQVSPDGSKKSQKKAQKKNKSKSSSTRKNNKKTNFPQQGSDLTQKLYSTMEKHREVCKTDENNLTR